MPRYQLISDDDAIGAVPLQDGPVTIGRHPDNDIVLRDDLASRFHCVVEPNGDSGYIVRDLGSRNGTRVNEKVIDRARLRTGDVIAVGGRLFRIDVVKKKDRRSEEKRKILKGEMRWVAMLVRLIETLPPKSSAQESITLIDAAGGESRALGGESVGPAAVRLLLLACSKSRSTDLHVEPKSEFIHVRIRVDGVMIHLVDLPSNVGELAMGLIRTACQLKVSSREAVQDGHFSAQLGERRVDYRASFTPSVHGQKLVLRVLDLRDTPSSLAELGMSPYMLEHIKRSCGQDSGMLIVVGPTGSGKTTTLYNCMRGIDCASRNVITIEDPVEYHIEGITQIPADQDRGNTFNSLLRSVLRQDPDVILVGEVRDEETARTAMQAAMTGHLVFSTLHARDTIGSIFRLLDLGIEPYLVANSLSLILAQRLLRVLCDHCKRETQLTPVQASKMGRYSEGVTKVYTATGCARCLRTGYRGRRAIFELMDFNDELRDVVLHEPSIQGMKKAVSHGLFTTLAQSSWQLVAKGMTSVEEVEHVTGNL